MTTLYINNTEADLDADTTIALTFQVNDVGDVPSRQGNYSNKFKLPLTAKNKQLVGYANALPSATHIPYTKLPATLVLNGAYTNQGYVVIEAVEEYIEAVFYSGNTPFFAAINDLKLNDLDLSEYNHPWNVFGVINSKNNTEGYIWPALNWHNTRAANSILNVEYMRPCLFVHTLVKKIAQHAGYTIAGNFATHPAFLNEILPITNNELKWTATSTENALALAQGGIDTFETDFNSLGAYPITLTPVTDITNAIDTSIKAYQCPGSGEYLVKATLRFGFKIEEDSFGNGNGNINFSIVHRKHNNGQQTDVSSIKLRVSAHPTDSNKCVIRNADTGETLFTPNFGSGVTMDIAPTLCNANYRDEFYLIAKSVFNTTGFKYKIFVLGGTWFEVKPNSNLQLEHFQNFEFTGNLPIISAKDFLKALAVRYALVFTTNEADKIVYLNRFDQMFENALPVADWTTKLHMGSPPQIEFVPDGFSQTTWFGYKNQQPDKWALNYGLGVITIDNANLKAGVEEIKQPFDFSNTENFQGIEMARVELFEDMSEDSTDTWQATQIEPRILMLKKQSGIQFGYYDILNSNQPNAGIIYQPQPDAIAYFFDDSQPHGLSFNTLIPKHYKALKTLLNNYKKVTCWLNLLPTDIANLNFLQPVAIEPLGSQFYVNKIQNYTPGKLTKVELVRL